MATFAFTPYARRRMRERQVPEAAVYAIVEDADDIIRRRDGRVEYAGWWSGRSISVVTEGDIEIDEAILVLNVIEDVRLRRRRR